MKCIAALVLVLIAASASAQDVHQRIDWKPYAALIAAQAADGITTVQAVNHGATEAVLPSGSALGMLAVKLPVALLQVYEIHKLESAGHLKAARITSYVCSAFVFTVAYHNHETMR